MRPAICDLRLLFLLCFLYQQAGAQYPPYFRYNDDSGLPFSQLYTMAQDAEGMIWLAGDAGLYRYDGIRYQAYKNHRQQSRSMTGLCLSASGRLYGYNFKGQIFYVENDSLHELPHSYHHIPNITTDNRGHLFVNHGNGLAVYDETTATWTNHSDFGPPIHAHFDSPMKGMPFFTKSVTCNAQNEAYFLSLYGLGKWANGQVQIQHSTLFHDLPTGSFVMACWRDENWLFVMDGSFIAVEKKGETKVIKDKKINQLLQHKKITNAKTLRDGSIWICTYQGLIQYHPESDSCRLFYPDLAFSDGLIDHEGNYWFTTLQTGLLRLPSFDYAIWNTDYSALDNDKIAKVSRQGDAVYFATLNGTIGRVEPNSHRLLLYPNAAQGDVHGLGVCGKEQQLYSSNNSQLFLWNERGMQSQPVPIGCIKSLERSESDYLAASSFGLFVFPKDNPQAYQQLHAAWARQIESRPYSDFWVAANDGLLRVQRINGQWTCYDTLLYQTQVLSISLDRSSDRLYALSFDGRIRRVDAQGNIALLDSLPQASLPNQLLYHDEKLYLATNQGVWIYDLATRRWEQLHRLSGLVSDKVQSLAIHQQTLWLATSKGLQKIPLQAIFRPQAARVLLHSLAINDRPVADSTAVQLSYRQSLHLRLAASAYSSQDAFRYAYRILPSDTSWTFLPASIEELVLQHLPDGHFNLEIKVIDAWGRDSSNRIHLFGRVLPPFWRTWWFYGWMISGAAAAVAWQYKRSLQRIRRKQLEEIAKMRLENEVQRLQQTALRAQMNPHFIFNVLNSIKAYIYENDKKNAVAYLSNFSDLVRKVLEMSDKSRVSLAEEIQLSELYIRLEAMLLQQDFSYTIEIDDSIDADQLKIPALIVQPYIENAFKHGLRHRKGQKRLDLRFYWETEQLLCIEIRDNGVGRAAAAALATASSTHRSFATDAQQKRLELYNRDKGNAVAVAFTDLFDAQGQAAGTLVQVRLFAGSLFR